MTIKRLSITADRLQNEPVGGIEGRTWILVDRNTGEVLLAVDEPG